MIYFVGMLFIAILFGVAIESLGRWGAEEDRESFRKMPPNMDN
jgi:hypothetical protein